MLQTIQCTHIIREVTDDIGAALATTAHTIVRAGMETSQAEIAPHAPSCNNCLQASFIVHLIQARAMNARLHLFEVDLQDVSNYGRVYPNVKLHNIVLPRNHGTRVASTWVIKVGLDVRYVCTSRRKFTTWLHPIHKIRILTRAQSGFTSKYSALSACWWPRLLAEKLREVSSQSLIPGHALGVVILQTASLNTGVCSCGRGALPFLSFQSHLFAHCNLQCSLPVSLKAISTGPPRVLSILLLIRFALECQPRVLNESHECSGE
mmetsp:Transcript_43092/g.99232  ORF Transcript_43092/g.99232 Transcript_43092/m.99232 type:complete len:264 (-) Transcript_43092:152-943(-)